MDNVRTEHMSDKAFIHDLTIVGTHGVYEHERHTEQEFIVDIEADIDARTASQTDALKDTVDYVQFKHIAEDVIMNNSFYLAEKIAAEIAQRILADTRITCVRVTVRKPAVLPNGVPGVTITRTRAS